MRDQFAPSPTGLLHIGHAYSTFTCWDNVVANNGEFILRIEDIDDERTKEKYIDAIFEDLEWLGLKWQQPVLYQSSRRKSYKNALHKLCQMGICYPCKCSRADINQALSAPQETNSLSEKPLSTSKVYPGTCRSRSIEDASSQDAIRLNIKKAIELLGGFQAVNQISYCDIGAVFGGLHQLDAQNLIETHGDVVLARKDIHTSYHLSVVVDDDYQDITHISRGQDLFWVTPIHRLLQTLLNLKTQVWNHHRLIRDNSGDRLAKRADSVSIKSLRDKGLNPAHIRKLIGI